MKEFAYYLAFRAVAGVIGALPEPVMRRSGEGIGWLLSFAAPRKLALVRRNLARVVGEDAATATRARRMFASYGRYWAETFWARPRRKEAILRHSSIEGGDRLAEAARSGRGVIVALPHIGNWEVAGAVAASVGASVLAAAESLPNKRLVDWFIATRAGMDIEVVVVGRDRTSTEALLARLRAGGAVALLADRDLSGRGVPVTFFGEETTMPSGPVALADRTGAILLPVGSYFREGRGHHYVIHDRLEIPDLPTRDARVRAGTQLLATELERCIEAAPEQWHLFQPNWPSDREETSVKVGSR